MTEPKWIFPDAPTVRHPRVYPNRTWRQAQEEAMGRREIMSDWRPTAAGPLGTADEIDAWVKAHETCPDCCGDPTLACVVCTPRRHDYRRLP